MDWWVHYSERYFMAFLIIFTTTVTVRLTIQFSKIMYRHVVLLVLLSFVAESESNLMVTLHKGVYPMLPLYEKFINVDKVKDTQDYKYLARLVPAYKSTLVIATVVCIAEHIFLSSARVVLGLTTGQVYVATHDDVYLRSLAILVIKEELYKSHTYYDDPGIVVTSRIGNAQYKFTTIPRLFSTTRPPGKEFTWADNSTYWRRPWEFFVVAYEDEASGSGKSDLYEMPVFIDIGYCEQIFTHMYTIDTTDPFYRVPCYSPCPFTEWIITNGTGACFKYFMKPGAPVIAKKDGNAFIVGISTWAIKLHLLDFQPINQSLPVGFSVPNTDTFEELFACANIITKLDDGIHFREDYHDACE